MNALTTSERKAAGARKAAAARVGTAALAGARRSGRPTYHGRPCASGHSGERYTSDQHCVECRAERIEWGAAQHRNTLLASLYPEEFDAMGWHRLAVEGE
jgi:hypothetical protein